MDRECAKVSGSHASLDFGGFKIMSNQVPIWLTRRGP
jgi:hypothetical protein